MNGTSPVVFCDVETTGLDPDRHEIWEVGLIVPGAVETPRFGLPTTYEDAEYHWYLPVDLARADVMALNIGRFHERHPWGHSNSGNTDTTDLEKFAAEFAALTWGKHLAGAVVSFDAERLAKLLRANGQCPGWHYHLIDVEALAIGWLAGQRSAAFNEGPPLLPPWKSDQLTEALGLVVDDKDKHTALGDARWAKAIYDKVMHGTEGEK